MGVARIRQQPDEDGEGGLGEFTWILAEILHEFPNKYVV